MPCEAAACDTNQVFTPSMLGWSMAASSCSRCSMKSSLRTITVAWRVPNCAASCSARGDSSFALPTYSAKASVRVCGRSPCALESAVMRAESMPADKNMPTGTSATWCAAMLLAHGRANGVERVALGAACGVGGGVGQDVGDLAKGLGFCWRPARSPTGSARPAARGCRGTACRARARCPTGRSRCGRRARARCRSGRRPAGP
jgi:hypothetical protein